MGPSGGHSIHKISKIAFLYYDAFSIFFSVSQPLNSMECLCLLDRWVRRLHGKQREILSHYLIWGSYGEFLSTRPENCNIVAVGPFSIYFFQYLSLLILWNAYACKTAGYPGHMDNIERSSHITSYGADREKF